MSCTTWLDSLPRLNTLNLQGRQVLLRSDFNVPMVDGRIIDSQRLEAGLPTLRYLLTQGAGIRLVTHLGRPHPDHPDPHTSVAPLAAWLTDALGQTVALCQDWPGHLDPVPPGTVALAPNTRWLAGETNNDRHLAFRMAQGVDVYVNDAFATSHRTHASTVGVTEFVGERAMGLALVEELQRLRPLFDGPKRPCMALIGGKKISTKLKLLNHLVTTYDTVAVVGALAHTFLLAQGHGVGQSVAEPAMVNAALDVMLQANRAGCDLLLPSDVRTTVLNPPRTNRDDAPPVTVHAVNDVPADHSIVDLGPTTTARLSDRLQQAGTLVWNGPPGWFERPQFAQGTQDIVAACTQASNTFCVAGGGDTLAALACFQGHQAMDVCSTGGGALLALLEDVRLPGLVALQADVTQQNVVH